jgi:hypothetical protein
MTDLPQQGQFPGESHISPADLIIQQVGRKSLQKKGNGRDGWSHEASSKNPAGWKKEETHQHNKERLGALCS